jgi:uncharacterized protein YfaT (DUF1175 family)
MRGVLVLAAMSAVLATSVRVGSGSAPAAEAIDADGDGYPDAAELVSQGDRRAFLEWFALIAEAQALAPDPRWSAAQRDCAGLLRFAYRAALEPHDATWLAHAPVVLGFAPDVQRFHAATVPFLGERLFRIAPGPFRANHVSDDFSASPTAERLVLGSARPLRAPEAPERGDVLLFRATARGVAHTMVFLGGDRVVYDTGGGADAPETVRVTTIEELLRHPDPFWHPTASNPAFAGFFRWRIVGVGAQR